MNFLSGTSHALDATLWTFLLELHTLLGGVLGGFGGANNVLSCAFYLTPLSWCYVVNFPSRTSHVLGGGLGGLITFFRVRFTWLRCLDATLWTFLLELHTLLMLRCELSFWNFTRSWCYVVNFPSRTSHALGWGFWGGLGGLITFFRLRFTWLRCLDATLWTFLLELRTLLMLRCELSFWNFTRSWCYVVNFPSRTSHALGGGLGGFGGG